MTADGGDGGESNSGRLRTYCFVRFRPEAVEILYYQMMRTTIKFVGIYIGLSVFLVLMWAIFSYPNAPSTPSGWLWAFLLAIPLQLAFEFLGELVSKNKATRFVEQKTAEQSFSLVRILYGVVLFLVFAGLVIGAGYGWHMLRQ
jgi:hypothetical protein